MDFVKLKDWLGKTEQERYDICKSLDSCGNCSWRSECQAEMTAKVIDKHFGSKVGINNYVR